VQEGLCDVANDVVKVKGVSLTIVVDGAVHYTPEQSHPSKIASADMTKS